MKKYRSRRKASKPAEAVMKETQRRLDAAVSALRAVRLEINQNKQVIQDVPHARKMWKALSDAKMSLEDADDALYQMSRYLNK
jgi:hypothetical protein